MGSFTTTYDRIIRQPALTMPGNFTGSEAGCTAGNASSIRTLLSLGTADSPSFSGLTLAGHLLFNPTNTYDVGNGTYDPRTVRAATSVLTPLVNNASAALTLGNSTYGVTVPGAATFSGFVKVTDGTYSAGFIPWTYDGEHALLVRNGTNTGNGSIEVAKSLVRSTLRVQGASTFESDVSMVKASAQGYIRAYSQNGTHNTNLFTINSGTGYLATSGGSLYLQPFSGDVLILNSGSNTTFRTYDASGAKYTMMTHDGTNGIVSTSSGALVLSPATSIIGIGGITSSFPALKRSSTTLAVRLGDDSADAPISCAGITASGVIYSSAGFTFPPDVYLNTPGPHPRMYFVSSGASIWACGTNSGSLHQFRNLAGATLLEVYSTGTVVTGTLTHTGGQQTGYVAKTANYTTTADDHLVNVTANSIDITLETAVGCAGRVHEIINTGSGTVTMKTTSAQTISGSASGALTLAQWKSMTVKSDGSNWLIISQIT